MQRSMNEKSFGKDTSANKGYGSKNESRDLEKNTSSEAGNMKKSMSNSKNDMNKNTADKAGSNKYFSSSDKKSSSTGKNMREDSYKKSDCDCNDVESTKRNRCR